MDGNKDNYGEIMATTTEPLDQRPKRERAAYLARRRRKNLARPNTQVDGYRAWWVVAVLRIDGFTYERIGELAGLHKSTVAKFARSEPGSTITFTTHQALMSVDLRTAKSIKERGRRVPAQPYRDKLRQYGAAGWPRQTMERMAGLTPGEENVWRDRSRWITPETAAKLDALFEQLADRAGPSIPSSRVYRKMGYGPPAAYDEVTGELIPKALVKLPPLAREKRAG